MAPEMQILANRPSGEVPPRRHRDRRDSPGITCDVRGFFPCSQALCVSVVSNRAKRTQSVVDRNGDKSFPGSELCKKCRVMALRKRTQLLSQACRAAGGASRGVWKPEKRLAASLPAGSAHESESLMPENVLERRVSRGFGAATMLTEGGSFAMIAVLPGARSTFSRARAGTGCRETSLC